MDLSKGFSLGRRPHSHTQPLDMTKKPEWYRRQPQNCGPELSSPYRTRSQQISLRPDLTQDRANFMSSPLAPGLDLYRDQVRNNLWHPGFYEARGDAGPESSGVEEEEEEEEEDSDSDSDIILLVTSAKEPLLCTTFIPDNVTHMVEPLSPSSLDTGRGCYDDLPQTSPSRDSSYTDESSESSVDIPIHHAQPIVLLSDLGAVYAQPLPAEASSDDSDVIEVRQSKKKLCKRMSQRETEARAKLRTSCRVNRMSSSNTPSQTTRSSLKRQVKLNAVGLYNEIYDSDDVLDILGTFSSSDESVPRQRMSSRAQKSNAETKKTQEKSPSMSPQREQPTQCKAADAECKRSNRQKNAPLIAKETCDVEQNCKEPRQEEEAKRTVKKRKRKRKFKQNSSSSLFTIEPEIALKYAYRKKRERKIDSFSPFVRIEEQSCTVVNYREEEAVEKRPNTSGFIPMTSCYNLGRVQLEAKQVEYLRCCLCGQTANAKTLGDLHGPYYPDFTEIYKARTQQDVENHHTAQEEVQSKSPKREEELANEALDLEECWMHSDCGVWSNGIFLVRGKLYGLKEAAQLAQQTTCWSCHQSGAIVGCFQKGCSRTFHVTCAVQSGCVLNEENFSMRCSDHKIKPCVSSRQPLR
uniref:PHD-type domain-containing protein n=1 Tax=Knipowitschia caucasica TaxID=637954 RepID=A0AAV2KJZ3_KNICA